MPGIRCPIKDCSYVTPDDVTHPELIIAILQLHGKEHNQQADAPKKVECRTASASVDSSASSSLSKSSDLQPHRKEWHDAAEALPVDLDASGDGDLTTMNSSATGAGDCVETTMKESLSSQHLSHGVHVQSVSSKTSVQLQPWPVKFRLPKEKFRVSLVRALAEGRPLERSEKEKLMDSLYDAVTRYTFRPKPSQYTEVISCLLISYPALKNGLVGQDAMGYWKKSLSNRFRNCRKRHERDNPLAQIETKKKGTTGTPKPDKAAGKHMYGIKNYLPAFPEGEDEETINAHIKMLQNESKKTRQDSLMIDNLMSLTLAHRRKGIIESNWTVSYLKDTYPCLFHEDEMLKEFERLSEEPIKQKLDTGLLKYADPLLKICKTPKQGLELKNLILASAATAEDEDTRKMIKSCGALVLIPTILGEKALLCRHSQENNGTFARISYKIKPDSAGLSSDHDIFTEILQSSFYITAENEVICETNHLMSAVSLLMSAHYVFNLSYNPKMSNTLTFIQKVLMNIDSTSQPPSKVVRCLYDLNAVLNADASSSSV